MSFLNIFDDAAVAVLLSKLYLAHYQTTNILKGTKKNCDRGVKNNLFSVIEMITSA